MFARIFWQAALVIPLVTGCCLLPPTARRALATPYKPTNVYLREPLLPLSIRRVALLPIPESRDDAAQAEGAQDLDALLLEEISKRKVAEIVPLTAAQVRDLTGCQSWAAQDMLPHDFFERLRQGVGCDAVLFVSLTAFEPYPPLRLGWKARLVDCTQYQTWWALDEVFDAGSESVAAAADAYARNQLNLPNPLLSDTGVLESPRRFGQYTAYAVAQTLPCR